MKESIDTFEEKTQTNAKYWCFPKYNVHIISEDINEDLIDEQNSVTIDFPDPNYYLIATRIPISERKKPNEPINRINEGDEEEIKTDQIQKFSSIQDEVKLKEIIKDEMYFN